MAGKWDNPLKRLVQDHPQDFVSWLLPQATVQNVLKTELMSNNIHADMLLEVTKGGERCALHLEFQSHHDTRMAQRLWDYNVRATIENNCPVYSYVVYLQPSGTLPRSPYCVVFPDDLFVHRFEFGVVDLVTLEASSLLRVGARALLPLLPLTRDGQCREVVEQMIEGLTPFEQGQNAALLVFAFEFASLVFQQEDERAWLRKRFSMFDNILRESWAFQEILQEGLQEGRQKGLQEGRQKGLQEGRQKGLQEGQQKAYKQNITTYLRVRFPTLLPFAQERLATLHDPELLLTLSSQIFAATTEEDVRDCLQQYTSERTEH